MGNLQKSLESALQEIAEGYGPDTDVDHLKEAISGSIPELTDELGEEMLVSIKEDAFPVGIEHHRAARFAFEQRLLSFWKEPLELLELFISLATEAGSEFTIEFRNEFVRKGDAVFEVLTRLHGRACQVSKEIAVLLRSGYADGAHARWRTLYELTVVGCLIGRYGQELAERYLLHRTIQKHKAAKEYQKHCERLGQQPLSQEEVDALKEERDRLIEHFGNPFETTYGWAASVTCTGRPGMSHLEKSAGLTQWGPYHDLASSNIHADSRGIYFRLGLSSSQEDVILAGPSKMGLADPGNSTAISLCILTTILLARKSTMDYVVYSKVLLKLRDEVGDAFLAAHHAVEADSGGESHG